MRYFKTTNETVKILLFNHHYQDVPNWRMEALALTRVGYLLCSMQNGC